MVNPMMGLTPEQMRAAQELGKYVGAKFTKERRRHRFTLEFVPKKSPEELAQVNIDLGKMVDTWVQVLGTQLYNYMGVGGEINNVD